MTPNPTELRECPRDEASRPKQILAGINYQNEPATFEGRKGFWVQADCVFIERSSPQAAIHTYRQDILRHSVACSHNHFCGSIMREKERFRADDLERENAELKAEIAKLRLSAAESDRAHDVRVTECERWAERCAELRKLVEEAPHSSRCEATAGLPCTCWKSRVPRP